MIALICELYAHWEYIETKDPWAAILIPPWYKKMNISKVNFTIQDRQDFVLPSWGVISNGGTVTISDTPKIIKEGVDINYFITPAKIKFSLLNTATKAKKQVGEFLTQNWEYDDTKNEATIKFGDVLTFMQQVNVKNEELKYTYVPKTSKDLYNELWIQSKKTSNPYQNIFSIKTFEELDKQTQSWLESITIQFPFLEGATLWRQWDKFSELTQTHIFVDNQGIITCKYYGGN